MCHVFLSPANHTFHLCKPPFWIVTTPRAQETKVVDIVELCMKQHHHMTIVGGKKP